MLCFTLTNKVERLATTVLFILSDRLHAAYAYILDGS